MAFLVHGLRQPLTAIRNNSLAARRFLSSENPDLDQVREALDDILADADRAATQIRDVHARLKEGCAGRFPVALSEVVREALVLTRREAEATGVTVDYEPAIDLPRIRGDRLGLLRVVVNLVRNAFDAMRHERGSKRVLRIRLSLEDGPSLLLTVCDGGTGLDPGATERLFEPYFTTKSDGFGMGLAICRSIVVEHEGRIWATENPEGGATFHVSLPVQGDDHGGPARLHHR